MEDLREVVVLETPIWAALDSEERARARVRVDRLPCLHDSRGEVAELKLVERFVTKRLLEDALCPLNILLRRRGMPLYRYSAGWTGDTHVIVTYAIEDVELNRALVAVSTADDLAIRRLDRLLIDEGKL